eukprot:1368468-Prymnesium_polylepis.1
MDVSPVPSIDGDAAPDLLVDWAMGNGEELTHTEKVVLESDQRDKRALPKVWEPYGDGSFQFADKALHRDKGAVLEAVQQYGHALKYADPEFHRDREIALKAVQRSGCALEFVDQDFRRDKPLVLEAAKSGYQTLKWA